MLSVGATTPSAGAMAAANAAAELAYELVNAEAGAHVAAAVDGTLAPSALRALRPVSPSDSPTGILLLLSLVRSEDGKALAFRPEAPLETRRTAAGFGTAHQTPRAVGRQPGPSDPQAGRPGDRTQYGAAARREAEEEKMLHRQPLHARSRRVDKGNTAS
eukprot:scaffold57779_cov30-Tisochrysis_lutea.AAC.8